jgi:hypothetical protein
MNFDDSIFELALHGVLDALRVPSGCVVAIDALRDGWRGTALRHSDLPKAIGLLVEAGSLEAVGKRSWRLTEAGRARADEVASVASPTMEDQVARSLLKTLRERVPRAGLAPRGGSYRRRLRAAGGRMAYRLDKTS